MEGGFEFGIRGCQGFGDGGRDVDGDDGFRGRRRFIGHDETVETVWHEKRLVDFVEVGVCAVTSLNFFACVGDYLYSNRDAHGYGTWY